MIDIFVLICLDHSTGNERCMKPSDVDGRLSVQKLFIGRRKDPVLTSAGNLLLL